MVTVCVRVKDLKVTLSGSMVTPIHGDVQQSWNGVSRSRVIGLVGRMTGSKLGISDRTSSVMFFKCNKRA